MTTKKRAEILKQVCTGCFKEKRTTKKFFSEHSWGYIGEFLKAHIVNEYNKGSLQL
jgi:hypothetical protein